MLEFSSAGKNKKAKFVPFTIDGEEFKARKPKDSQLMLLVASGASEDPSDQMYEVLQFFKAVLDEDSIVRFLNLLRDSDSNFELGDAVNVLQGLIKEFSGRPTE